MSSREEYSTEEEHERLERARKIVALIENKPLHLWRLFREASLNGGACRDIVEKHVMCKLNGTDLKFLYGVNTETRKLIKRSSRISKACNLFQGNLLNYLVVRIYVLFLILCYQYFHPVIFEQQCMRLKQ